MERSRIVWRVLRNAIIGAAVVAAAFFVISYVGTFFGHAPEGWRIGWEKGWAENWMTGLLAGALLGALSGLIFGGDDKERTAAVGAIVGGFAGILVIGGIAAFFSALANAVIVGVAAANLSAPHVLGQGALVGAGLGLVFTPFIEK